VFGHEGRISFPILLVPTRSGIEERGNRFIVPLFWRRHHMYYELNMYYTRGGRSDKPMLTKGDFFNDSGATADGGEIS